MKYEIIDAEPYIINVPVNPEVFPRKLAFGNFPGLVRVLFKLTATDGTRVINSYGESTPTFPFTNETPLSVYEILQNYVKPSLLGYNLKGDNPEQMEENIESLLDSMAPTLLHKRLPMVQAAADHSLHDLSSKILNLPVWRMLTEKPKRTKLKGIWSTSGDIAKSIEEARRYLKKGYAIKLKLFGNVEEDLKLTQKVLEYGDGLCADANETYTPEDTIEFIESVRAPQNFFLEEPICIAKYGRETLLEIINYSPIRIMLDESVYSREDFIYYLTKVEEGAISPGKLLMNIKVEKVGGLREAYSLANIASKYNVDIMIGGMFPSTYGKLVNAQLAIALENLVPSDGVHPASDYISRPLIKDVEVVEQMVGGYRLLNPFFERPGMGADIDEYVLRDSVIKIDLPENYLHGVVQARF